MLFPMVFVLMFLINITALFHSVDNESELLSIKDYLFPNEAEKIRFNSNVGEAFRDIFWKDNKYIVKSYSGNFEFTQRFTLRNDSVFVDSIYKSIDILYFFTKNKSVRYTPSFLRFPAHFSINDKWESTVYEISEDVKREITISVSVLRKEKLKIKLGEFDTILFEMIVTGKKGVISKMLEWRAKNIGLVKMEATVKSSGLIGVIQSLLGLDKFTFELNGLN